MVEFLVLDEAKRSLTSLSTAERRDCLGVIDTIRRTLAMEIPWGEVIKRFRLRKVVDAGTDLWECKKLRQFRIILLRDESRVLVLAIYRKKGEAEANRHLRRAAAVAKQITKE